MILPRNINLPPLLVHSLADVHSRNQVRHEHPNIRLREKASRANPPSESKHGFNLLTRFTCHLFWAKEPLWVKLVRRRVHLFIACHRPGMTRSKRLGSVILDTGKSEKRTRHLRGSLFPQVQRSLCNYPLQPTDVEHLRGWRFAYITYAF